MTRAAGEKTLAQRLQLARAHLRSALKLVSYTQAKMTLADVWITDIQGIPEKSVKALRPSDERDR